MDPQQNEIEAGVAARFSALARDPASEQRFPAGRASALALGYAAEELDALPSAAVEAFAGVGNPFSLGRPRPGEMVVDVGCGAGMDALLAALWVTGGAGPSSTVGRPSSGRVAGVDMVPEMLARAAHAAKSGGVRNAEFRLGRADSLPVPDAAADLALTNGVLNLCVDKPRVAAEIYRVLRPGGRLQMADILLEPNVTPEEVAARGAWSD